MPAGNDRIGLPLLLYLILPCPGCDLLVASYLFFSYASMIASDRVWELIPDYCLVPGLIVNVRCSPFPELVVDLEYLNKVVPVTVERFGYLAVMRYQTPYDHIRGHCIRSSDADCSNQSYREWSLSG